MAMMVSRDQLITAICTQLSTVVTDLKLVKPYHGELDRYSKKSQIQNEIFPAMVNLTTPFALVVSKNRRRLDDKGTSVKFRHEISIYIGDSNQHDFNNKDVPGIFTLMSQCLEALHGKVFVKGGGVLTVESDGEYLVTTDLFTVYDQKYFQLEIGT